MSKFLKSMVCVVVLMGSLMGAQTASADPAPCEQGRLLNIGLLNGLVDISIGAAYCGIRIYSQ